MKAPSLSPKARRAALSAGLALVLAAITVGSRGVVHAPGPVAFTLTLAAVGTLASAWVSSEGRLGASLSLFAAAARAGAALLLCEQWASEARELWGAIVVAVVWSDCADGASPKRPLAPLGMGLAWAIAWSALRPSDAVPRVAAVAAIAAFGVERFRKRESAQTDNDDDASSKS
jgi:hypothetical protein